MTDLRELNKDERISKLYEHHRDYHINMNSLNPIFIRPIKDEIALEFFEGIQENILLITDSPSFEYTYEENGKKYTKNFKVYASSFNSIEEAIEKINKIEDYEFIAFYSISKSEFNINVDSVSVRYAIIEDYVTKKIIERDNKIDSILKK
jgi:hypothetical protein